MVSSSAAPLNRFFGFLLLLCVIGRDAALRVVGASSQANNERSTTTYRFGCDFGPDALTNNFGKHIPRTCIDVPYHGSGDERSSKNNTAVGVLQRCYYSYVPDSCVALAAAESPANAKLKIPLVFDVHGYGLCPLIQAGFTGWMQKAEAECFVVVWPSAGGTFQTIGESKASGAPCWNLKGLLRSDDYGTKGGNNVTTYPCCCSMDGHSLEQPNDPLFLKMAIDSVVESFERTTTATTKPTNDPETRKRIPSSLSIDTNRVYMAGHSNGCIAGLSMAALYSDTIAAVCCHAGTLATPFPPHDSYTPVPIWLAHGRKDTIIPFGGSSLFDVPPFGTLGFWSVEQTLDYLSQRNGCSEEHEIDLPTPIDHYTAGSADSNAIAGTVFRRSRCRKNADIEVVALSESGHFPFYGLSPSFFASLGDAAEAPTVVDTTALAWEFCGSHTRNNPEPKPQQQHEPDSNNEKRSFSSSGFVVAVVILLYAATRRVPLVRRWWWNSARQPMLEDRGRGQEYGSL